ncbi:hypothetical protein Mal15_21900 [Stieleria maiorica]|uniref:Uncharacterized protein n=1 Tax=Stieleria maiorica TaxID=2795974 RepID=A0A5B9MA93_9BACT|nr:hypothetical protein Mal15_21900 [Stieleria maiorica]
MQEFCENCRRIHSGNHVCRKSGPAASGNPSRWEWRQAVRKVCNESCEHWGSVNGSKGCTLIPKLHPGKKPCDIGPYFHAKGLACLADPPKYQSRDEVCQIAFPEFRHECQGGSLAIVTAMIGDQAKELGELTLPPMQAYADRCGADLVVIDRDQFPAWPIANKFAVESIAEKYDRTLFLDIDCYVRDTCPNLFERCGRGAIWMHPDRPFIGSDKFLRKDARILGKQGQRLQCYNTGVALMDREHASVWHPPECVSETTHTLEQSSVEVRAVDAGHAIRNLPTRFNSQYWMGQRFWRSVDDAQIIHFANADHSTRLAQIERLVNGSWVQPIVVMTTPRTGSNLLVDSLATHPQAVSASEWFSPTLTGVPAANRARGLGYCNLFKVFESERQMDGFKEIRDRSFRIYLYRRDVDAQLTSWRLACESGWFVAETRDKPVPFPANATEQIAAAERVFRADADLAIAYEDMIANWNDTIANILRLAKWKLATLQQARRRIKPRAVVGR